jgi:8-oxo-dGTP pyrophosphatase MutT (NUDIX family)
MATTAIFVEILIIGLEAFIWIALLSGTDAIQNCTKTLVGLKEYSALITMLVVAAAYVLGIFIDRIADNYFKRFRFETKTPASVGMMRLHVMKESEGIAKFVDYQRSRLRIARATYLNLLITMVAGLIWAVRYGWYADSHTIIFIICMFGIGGTLVYIAHVTTCSIDKAQIFRLIEAYELIMEKNGGIDMPMPVAAAICFRRDGNDIKLLLVRTKGGKQWTFPKGHVKSDLSELLWETAKREAEEEAGANGTIETEPLTHYAYFKGDHSPEQVIAAYMMCVESTGKSKEPKRDPTWFSPDDAMKKLSRNREEKYAVEHKRVIIEALARLK